MKLQKLGIKNFKCFTGYQLFDIDQHTHIEGENGTGKSTILNAIELLLTGKIHNPATGKNADILDYFTPTGEDITVTGKVDDYNISRTFTRKDSGKKPSVTESLEIHPIPLDQNQKEITGMRNLQAWLEGLLGSINFFDFRDFFQKSEKQQFDQLFELFGGSKITWSGLMKQVQEKWQGKKALDLYYQDLMDPNLKGLHLINDAYRRADNWFKETNQTVTSFKKTVKSLNEILADKKKISGELVDLKADLEELYKKRINNKNAMSQTENILKVLERKRSRLAEINELSEVADDSNKKMQVKLKQLYKEYRVESLEELSQERTQVRQNLDSLHGQVIEMREDKLSASDDIVEFLQEMRAKLEHEQECPFCNSVFSEDSGLQEAIENMDYLIVKYQDGEDSEEYRSVIEEEKRVLAVKEQIDEDYNTAYEIVRGLDMASNRDRERANLKEEIDSLQKELQKYGGMETMQEIENQLAQEISQLQEDIETKNQEIGILAAQQESFQKYEVAKEQLAVAKFLKSALVDIKHDYIQKAFGQFMSRVDEDFRFMNGEKDPWRFEIRFQDERGNNVFQPGLVPDDPPTPYNDGFIPFSSINEGHRLKILMAFMLNIPQKGMKIFLLDNTEHISQQYVYPLFEGFSMLKGRYDNIITTSAHPISSLFKYEEGEAAEFTKVIKL